jgi:hypothetical protein
MSSALALAEPVMGEAGSASSAQCGTVIPLSNAGEWLVTALRALGSVAELPPGWDGYGSPAPNQGVIESAIRVLVALQGQDLPAPHVVPVPGGGVQLEWHVRSRELELEVLPDATLAYLMVGEGDQKIEGHLQNPRDAARVCLGWLAGT